MISFWNSIWQYGSILVIVPTLGKLVAFWTNTVSTCGGVAIEADFTSWFHLEMSGNFGCLADESNKTVLLKSAVAV